MSVAKIERDIKLLETKLRELDTTIADPIERNELKRELEKKIKKLQRTKTQIENLEREQQELESLKSDLLLENNDLAAHGQESESEKSTPSTANYFTEVEPEINLEKGIKNNASKQGDRIESESEKHEATSQTISSSNNSKKSGKVWIISGTIAGLCVLLGLVSTTLNARYTADDFQKPDFESRIPKENTRASNTRISTSESSDRQIQAIDNTSQSKNQIRQKYTKTARSQELKYFSNYQFPLASCGEQDPGGTNAWYPVFIENTENNLSLVRNQFCQDSIQKYRQKREKTSIQVASFVNRAKAEEFSRLMQNNLGSGEVGEPTVRNLNKASNSYYSSKQSKPSNSSLTIDELTDRIFYKKYPQLKGRKIGSNETYLKQEWKQIRNCEATVDYLFYQRHPERQNTTISSYEKDAIKEWLTIKRNVRGCYLHHTSSLPIGNYSFYEKGLKRMVSYQRNGNLIVGGVYSSHSPRVVTCFSGIIDPKQVTVKWWDNLWQIGKSRNYSSYSNSYTIAAFTADNGTPQAYWDNSYAVKKCS